MTVHLFTFNPFQENTYLLADEKGQCVIIDPGMSNEEEDLVLFDWITQKQFHPIMVVNTHCHIDHILGNKSCVERYAIPLLASKKELVMLDRAPAASLMWNIPYRLSPMPTGYLSEGETLEAGSLSFDVLEVPGHSPGHLALVNHADRIVISGDVLFRGSIGRTDLPLCDGPLLLQSIREKMYVLPEDYVVLPGHGPETTIGHEKASNPFVRP